MAIVAVSIITAIKQLLQNDLRLYLKVVYIYLLCTIFEMNLVTKIK